MATPSEKTRGIAVALDSLFPIGKFSMATDLPVPLTAVWYVDQKLIAVGLYDSHNVVSSFSFIALIVNSKGRFAVLTQVFEAVLTHDNSVFNWEDWKL